MLLSKSYEISLSFPVSPEGVVILIFSNSEDGAQGNFLRYFCFLIYCGHIYKTAYNYQNSKNLILKMDKKLNRIRGRE